MGWAPEAFGRGLDVVAYLSHAGEELAEVLLSGTRQVGRRAVLPGSRICAPGGMPQIVSEFEPTYPWSRARFEARARPRKKGDAFGKENRKKKVVRGIWLWHVVVVFAVCVELYTSAAGQAAAALDLPRLAGFASGR